jgi:GNAT superfamily N-acetyltransferase
MIEIKDLKVNDITPNLLFEFNHQQKINRKWVKCNGRWELVEASDLREWDKEKRIWVSEYLCEQIERGGSVVAAFDGDCLVGFCSIDGYIICDTIKYANLTMLFVDDKWARKGIGRKLFDKICTNAVAMKVDRIFISAIPSFETIAFYVKMGCEDVHKVISEFIDTEQDRYLEYKLEA